MERKLTCIVCPIGCSLTAHIKENGEVEVSGNTCKRGKIYAQTECIAPMRTITTTVRCQNGEILPVKTDSPIPKEKIFEAMKIINKACPVLPIKVKDVIIENVFGSNVIAIKNLDYQEE